MSIFETAIGDSSAPRSQATSAYRVIRGDILAGRHRPDTKLKIQDLATELNVSPGAVREALSRLVPEQLVLSREQRGFAVAPLSIDDLQDLTDLRADIEEIALRRAVERGDPAWDAALNVAADRLDALSMRDAGNMLNPEWAAAHNGFHATLISACRSRRLLAFHAQLFEQFKRYRGLTAYLSDERDVRAEHKEMLALALARDGDGLAAAAIAHLRRTTELIVAALWQAEAAE